MTPCRLAVVHPCSKPGRPDKRRSNQGKGQPHNPDVIHSEYAMDAELERSHEVEGFVVSTYVDAFSISSSGGGLKVGSMGRLCHMKATQRHTLITYRDRTSK